MEMSKFGTSFVVGKCKKSSSLAIFIKPRVYRLEVSWGYLEGRLSGNPGDTA